MNNPLRDAIKEQDWTIGDLANACDLSYTTVYKAVAGNVKSINTQILDTLEQVGYDRNELVNKYEQFRQEQRAKLLS